MDVAMHLLQIPLLLYSLLTVFIEMNRSLSQILFLIFFVDSFLRKNINTIILLLTVFLYSFVHYPGLIQGHEMAKLP